MYKSRHTLLGILFVSLSLLGLTATAGTADGVTPAVEDTCAKWGYTGKLNGLCNAYCEAMDCDSDNPHASQQACERVFNNITGLLDGQSFPACSDTDGDGFPNGIDNCPSVANADQLDSDQDGIGDVCDNCIEVANADQYDGDVNGIGKACQPGEPIPLLCDSNEHQCPDGSYLGKYHITENVCAECPCPLPGQDLPQCP
jgi:hypothetical protein